MFDKAKRTYSVIAIIVLNFIILFVVVEAGSAAVMYAYYYLQSHKPVEKSYKYNPRENLAYYQEQEWGIDYWREHQQFGELGAVHLPYIGWRRNPYCGDLINVDSSYLRITPNSEEADEALIVFCFGGSTMFGFGSPDWGTIPAYLAQILNARFGEKPIKVVNFGQGMWISSQGTMQLIQEIKHDNIPDIVVFYDGACDTGWAYRYGEPDVPRCDPANVPYFQTMARETQFETFMTLCSKLDSVRIAKGGLRRLFGYRQIEVPEPAGAEEMNIDELSRDVVSTYLHNMDTVEALSNRYGFDCHFFWQPSLYEESKPLTPEEQEIREGLVAESNSKTPGLIELRRAVYELIRGEVSKRDNLYYIADVFNTTEDFIYMDGAHIVPEGNKVVAEKMASIIADSVSRMIDEGR